VAEETFVQKQIRLVLEKQCREAAEHLAPKIPAGTGFALFLFDFGAKGNLAYCSTGEADDVLAAIGEWLELELRRRGVHLEDE